MKYKGIAIILLIATSTAVFVPIFNIGREVKLLPWEKNTINININRPDLQISTDIQSAVNITIYKYHSEDLELISDFQINGDYTVDKLSPGYYVMEFISSELGTVALSPKGVYTVTVILFFTMLIINMYLLYDKYSIVYE